MLAKLGFDKNSLGTMWALPLIALFAVGIFSDRVWIGRRNKSGHSAQWADIWPVGPAPNRIDDSRDYPEEIESEFDPAAALHERSRSVVVAGIAVVVISISRICQARRTQAVRPG